MEPPKGPVAFRAFYQYGDGETTEEPLEEAEPLSNGDEEVIMLPPTQRQPPALAAVMIEHKVAQAFEQQQLISTRVSLQEFEAFKAFYADWMEHPTPPNWTNAAELQQFYQQVPPKAFLELLDNKIFSRYQTLQTLYAKEKWRNMTPRNLEVRREFILNFWILAGHFNRLCERDAEAKGGRMIAPYKPYYAEKLHPYYLTLQRFANFVHLMLKKENAINDRGNLLEIHTISEAARLGFYRQRQGFLPVTLNFNPNSLEVIYNFIGDNALPSTTTALQSQAFLVDHGEFVTQNGFIVELNKMDPGSVVVACIRGYFGADADTPFFVSPQSQHVALNALDSKSAYLLDLIEDDIQAFLKKSDSPRDSFFIPLPRQGGESKEFAYCLLQDLIIRSQNRVRPEDQKQAQVWLLQIEQIEGKPAEAILKELEAEIKADLRTEYERQVEEEQRLRSQRVSEGKTQGAGSSKKASKAKKREKAVQQPEAKPKSVDERVEEAFKKIKVKGRVKFRTMMKLTQKVLKQSPDLFLNSLQAEKQQGSHHVLHMEHGPATIVEPHGKKDRTISPKSANRFLGALMDQVRKAFSP